MSQPVELGVSDEYEIIVVGSGEGGKYLVHAVTVAVAAGP